MRKEWQNQLDKWKERRTEIYNKYKEGMSFNELAREYKLSNTRISNIVQSIENA